MGTKVGRNELCPCGSEKKYKKCCYGADSSVAVHEIKLRRLNKVYEDLVDKNIKFAVKNYGSDSVHKAWKEFHLFDEENEFDPNSPIMQIFMPWFFYSWTPDPEVFKEVPFDAPPAEAMIGKEGQRLTDLEKEYIKACCDRAFSFYEIIEARPGYGLDVRDLLTNEGFSVQERKGSENAIVGNIFFGKVISVQDELLFDGLAPIQIPAQFGLELVDLRESFSEEMGSEITNEMLFDFEEILLEVFWSIWDHLHNPEVPILTNTDGHLLIPHKLIYQIDSVSDIFEILHPLCLNNTREKLLEGGTYSEDGALKEIDFPWLVKGNKRHSTWENTVHGHIFLTETKMTVDTNSKERATRFKSLLTKKTKEGWKLRSTLIEPIEKKLEERGGAQTENHELSNEDLMRLPEVQNHMESMLKKHWDGWINEPLPALSGETPAEAARTKNGKEKLRFLLNGFESKARERPMPGQNVEVFNKIRKKLGL